MASRQAIGSVGQAILGVLADACPKPEFAGARFELFQPINFQNPIEEGISLFLYRVTVNTTRRSIPPRTESTGTRFKGPLPIDLNYMLTPWARTADRQHRLLAWAMRVLQDNPVLGSGVLNHYGTDSNVFRTDEAVELLVDQIPLLDMGAIWEVSKHNEQPSVIYVVRGLNIDSDQAIDEPVSVSTRRIDYAKVMA